MKNELSDSLKNEDSLINESGELDFGRKRKNHDLCIIFFSSCIQCSTCEKSDIYIISLKIKFVRLL